MSALAALKRWIHGVLPRRWVNLAWNLASDLKELPARWRDPMPRPWRVWHSVGGGDFHQIGQVRFTWLVEAAGVSPSDHVLDMGCGSGRVAFPLAQYLNAQGRYTGFDLSERALRFARQHVKGVSDFQFIHADVASAEYAATGAKAAQYVFPTADESVDAALAVSLFSHLLPEDAARYLKETGRVLKPGKRICLTAFILDDDVKARMRDASVTLPMVAFRDGAYAADVRHPERAIGFDKVVFEAWMAEAGLDWAQPLLPGHWNWPHREGEFQDRIVLEKRR